MANPLFEQLGGNQPSNGMAQFMSELKRMQQTFKGNPQDEVQRLLNSGKLSQAEFNHYAQMANEIMAMLPK